MHGDLKMTVVKLSPRSETPVALKMDLLSAVGPVLTLQKYLEGPVLASQSLLCVEGLLSVQEGLRS